MVSSVFSLSVMKKKLREGFYLQRSIGRTKTKFLENKRKKLYDGPIGATHPLSLIFSSSILEEKKNENIPQISCLGCSMYFIEIMNWPRLETSRRKRATKKWYLGKRKKILNKNSEKYKLR